MSSVKNISLEGIIVPLVTPLLGPDRLDVDSLCHLVDHVIKGQVRGIFILGTTGEGPSLSCSMHEKIIKETCRYTNWRAPVLVGVIETSLSDAVAMARIAADHSADAVVLSAPYYFSINQNVCAGNFITRYSL